MKNFNDVDRDHVAPFLSPVTKRTTRAVLSEINHVQVKNYVLSMAATMVGRNVPILKLANRTNALAGT